MSETSTLRVFTPNGRLLATSKLEIYRQIYHWLDVSRMREALQNQTVGRWLRGFCLLRTDYTHYVLSPAMAVAWVYPMSITLAQFQRQFYSLIATVLGIALLSIKRFERWSCARYP